LHQSVIQGKKTKDNIDVDQAFSKMIRKRKNRHTVKAGHYIVLAAITSKFIWTPREETKETHKKRELIYTRAA